MLFGSSAGSRHAPADGEGNGGEPERRPLERPWLRARVAAAFSLALVFFLLWWMRILPSDSTQALILICALEICSLPVYRYFDRTFRKEVFQAYCRWITDILLITVALHFLGGMQAFMFSFLYCLVILSSSMMSKRRDSFLMATFSAASYGTLVVLESEGILDSRNVWEIHLGGNAQWFILLWSVLFFYLTAYFSSVFSGRLRERGRTLEIVNAISRVSSSSLALGEILNRTLDFLVIHLRAEAGIMQVASHWEDIRSADRGVRRFPPDLPENEKQSLGRLVKILAEENEPVILRDLRNDPKSRHLGIRWVGSLIASPIMHKGENVGIFVLLDRKARRGRRKRRFRQQDLDLMSLITQQVAPAIVNARLFTNLEEANRNIRKAQDEIVKREKFEALGEMISGMGHQFRNPLLAIGAAAKRLSKGNRIPDGMRFYVQIIQSETEKLEKILKGVPGFNIGTDCNRIEVDVNVLIDRALALVFENGSGKNIRIERDFEKMKDPLPSADPDQLEVALYNLFSNAGEAMGPGGILKVKTRLESGAQGRVLRIEVSDTGGGIPSEEVENIFNPFYTTKHWGTGLGLTMTHRIVENHGGEIRVLNRPGEGVTIQIDIPNA
jgi:signal transduction histidine kinase